MKNLRIMRQRELPQKYRFLLCHGASMTRRLEKYHRERMLLEVLKSGRKRQVFRRDIILASPNGVPREFARIMIRLDRIGKKAARDVARNAEPFGRILIRNRMPIIVKDAVFFVANPPRYIAQALHTRKKKLYGRRYRMLSAGGKTIAEVVEVLP